MTILTSIPDNMTPSRRQPRGGVLLSRTEPPGHRVGGPGGRPAGLRSALPTALPERRHHPRHSFLEPLLHQRARQPQHL